MPNILSKATAVNEFRAKFPASCCLQCLQVSFASCFNILLLKKPNIQMKQTDIKKKIQYSNYH